MTRTPFLLALAYLSTTSLVSCAHCAPASMKARDRALWAAIAYCASVKGEPADCCIAAAAGGSDPWIERHVSRMGARVVGPSWISSADRSHMVSYLEIDNFVWKSPHIARVDVYLSEPFESDPSAVMETTGTIYIELDKGRWKVDGSKTQMRDMQ